MDNSSPKLFDVLSIKKINCCRTVRPNRRIMTNSIKQKMKLKQNHTEMARQSNNSHGEEKNET
jgi:hypothetical protein